MSQQSYLQNLPEQQRRDILENGASQIHEGKYYRPLSEEDMIRAKDTLAENSIKLSDLNEELAEIKKEFKEKMEPYTLENKMLLTDIRTKQRLVEGTLYDLPNYEDGMMESYSAAGELISTRRLLPSEKQGNVFPIKKAANQ